MRTTGRPVRADAQRSTARILAAAEAVLSRDPTATLEDIAEEAGLARATVHRRFASRQALLQALSEQLHDRYRSALAQAGVATAPALTTLWRLTEAVFELKVSHRFAVQLPMSPPPQDVLDQLDLLFARLDAAGAVAVASPSWGRHVYLALLNEVHELPADAPELGSPGDAAEELAARVELLVTSVLGALGPARKAPAGAP